MISKSTSEKVFLVCFICSIPSVMLGYEVLTGFALLSFFTVIFLLGISGIREALYPTPIMFGWLAFLGLCALSLPTSLDPADGAESVFFLTLILIFAALAAHFLRQSSDRLQFIHIGLIIAILSMISLALVHIHVFEGLLRIIHFSSDTPASFDRILLKKPASGFVLLLPIALYLCFNSTHRLRIMAFFAVLGIVWLIVTSESRSAMAAALASVAIMGFLAMIAMYWRGWKIGLFVLLMIAIVAATILYMQHSRGDWGAGALGIPGWIIDNPRQVLWNEVLILLQQDFPKSLFSGYGVNALDELDRGMRALRYTEENITSFTAISTHPHNWLLEIAVEVGVIGLLSVLIACGLVLHWAWQQRRDAPAEVTALFGVYAAFTSASLFNYSIWSVWWQIDFAMMNALCAAMIVQRKASR